MHSPRTGGEHDPLDELDGLNVLLVHPRDADGLLIQRQLQRVRCHVGFAWPPPPEAAPDTDAAFVLLDGRPVMAEAFWAAAPARLAIVAIVADERAATAIPLCNVHAAIVRPMHPAAILTNLLLARNNFRYEFRLQTKISKLEDTLRAFRKVEQAKLILMRQRMIGENEAYEYLRRQAMNRRVSVAAIASAIVEANDLLK
jgi:AmiR/NasT family two-component response regulator